MVDLFKGIAVSRWITGCMAGVISLVVAAGCGGGDDSTALTKAEFAKVGNLICTKSRWQIRGGFAYSNRRYYQIEGVETENEPANISLEHKLLEQTVERFTVPAMKKRLKELEELGPPDGDEAQFSKMLETQAMLIGEFEDEGIGAKNQYETLSSFQQEASAYGLKCSATYQPSPPEL